MLSISTVDRDNHNFGNNDWTTGTPKSLDKKIIRDVIYLLNFVNFIHLLVVLVIEYWT